LNHQAIVRTKDGSDTDIIDANNPENRITLEDT